MRKVILWMLISLDGFIEGPNGELDWHMVDDELHHHFNDELGVGGADLAATFMRYDLVDEYRLYVQPVVIGRGKPLFPASRTMVSLQLAEARPFGNGVVLLRYQRPDPVTSD